MLEKKVLYLGLLLTPLVMKKIVLFLLPYLLITPLSAAQMGAVGDQKSADDYSDIEGAYHIYEPLVLLVGICKYDSKSFCDMSFFEEKMFILYDFFSFTCHYDVRTTFYGKNKKIVHDRLTQKEFFHFLCKQRRELEKKEKKYDALIFLFCGHGDGEDKKTGGFYCSDAVSIKDIILFSLIKKMFYLFDMRKFFFNICNPIGLKEFSLKNSIKSDVGVDFMSDLIRFFSCGYSFIKDNCEGISVVNFLFFSFLSGRVDLHAISDKKLTCHSSSLDEFVKSKTQLSCFDCAKKNQTKYLRSVRLFFSPRREKPLSKKYTKNNIIRETKEVEKDTMAKLRKAVIYNKYEEVENIIKYFNVEINYKYAEFSNETLLHAASRRGYVKIVRLLLENGADKELENRGIFGVLFRHKAVELATYFNHKEVAEIINNWPSK